MAQTRPSPTLSRGFTRLGRFLAPYAIWMRVRPIIPLVDLHLSRRNALADLSVASAFTTDC